MTFNLRKQAIGFLDQMVDGVVFPAGVNPIDAQFLWNNIYKNNPNFTYNSIQDMVNDLQRDGIEREMASWSNPEQVANALSPAENMESVNQQLQTVLQEAKPFNLKKAQEAVPFGPDDFNDSAELGEEQFGDQQGIDNYKKYQTHNDLNSFLLQMANDGNSFQLAWNDIQQENPQEPDSAQSALKEYYNGFDVKGDEERLDEAGVIYDFIYGKEGSMTIQAPYKELGASVNEASQLIKKLAQDAVKKNKKKSFNLTKTAQHKSLDNAILWGPGQSRIDPFLKQPVSDWHIVERNKGFGLVVDDVWNIDYETIWRENIMDKYSRPYRDKEGNWVGGYIQKRFEVDKNIPEASNYQLKPGQRRKPVLPEYGNTESRLQAARAAGDIEGANDTSKPFNWKEAKSKKMEKQATGMGLDEGLVDYYVRTVKQNAQKYPQMDFDTLMEFSSVPQGLYAKVSRLVQGGMEQNPQPQGHGTNSFSRGENSLIDMGSPVQASSKKKR